MSDVQEKLARSLTAESKELIPYLPYLLQDLYDLGASPQEILQMLKEHVPLSEDLQILDLACGKGAVSITLAKALGCTVKGIDILPEFIAYAQQKAAELKAGPRCTFEVGDVNEAVVEARDWDVCIFAAAGDVLGDPQRTLQSLKGVVRDGGYIVLDDAYVEPSSSLSYYTLAYWHSLFQEAGLALLAEKPISLEELEEINQVQQAAIRQRAQELMAQEPEKAALFQGYIDSQQAECDDLEGEMTGVAWLLQKQ